MTILFHLKPIPVKTSFFLTGLVCLFSLGAFSAEDAAPFRIWTNTEGKQLNAQLVSIDGDTITIKTDRGRVYPDLKLEMFSDDDRAWVQAYQEEQAAKEAEALKRPKTETLLATAGELLVDEHFEKISEDWRRGPGSWEAEGGMLTAQEREEDNHGAVLKRAMPLTNAVVEFEVKLSETAKQAAFGFDSNDHICRIQIMPKAFLIKKDDHDHEGPDEAVLLEKKELETGPDEWLPVRLELVGSHFLAEVNGETAYGSHELIASEKTRWGLVVGGGPVQFRALRVWAAEPSSEMEKAIEQLRKE